MDHLLYQFVVESNMIEGIHSPEAHVDHYDRLVDFLGLKLGDIDIDALIAFNTAGELRKNSGMNVRIGNHIPPPGGDLVVIRLDDIIKSVHDNRHPYSVHIQFESLHPFTDGNGRTGRALWLFQMIEMFGWNMNRTFLHEWYYQSLSFGRGL